MTDILFTTVSVNEEGNFTPNADEQIEVSFLVTELYSRYPTEIRPEVFDIASKQGINLDEMDFIHKIYDHEEEEEPSDALLEPNEVKIDVESVSKLFESLGNNTLIYNIEDIKNKLKSMSDLCDKAIQDNNQVVSYYY